MQGIVTSAEYYRLRENAQRIISRARRDDIDTSGLYIPPIPKRITAGSVRRMEKIHQEIKEEIARRRRIARYLPRRKSPVALENLKKMIKDAANYHEKGKTERYIAAVQASGKAAQVLMDRIEEIVANDVQKKYPKKSPLWREITTENTIITNAENLLREQEEKVNKFLTGYEFPNEDPKPSYYAIMRAMLGAPLSPEEEEDLFHGEFELWQSEEYE